MDAVSDYTTFVARIAKAINDVDSAQDGDVVWWECIKALEHVFPGLRKAIEDMAE